MSLCSARNPLLSTELQQGLLAPCYVFDAWVHQERGPVGGGSGADSAWTSGNLEIWTRKKTHLRMNIRCVQHVGRVLISGNKKHLDPFLNMFRSFAARFP